MSVGGEEQNANNEIARTMTSSTSTGGVRRRRTASLSSSGEPHYFLTLCFGSRASDGEASDIECQGTRTGLWPGLGRV